MIGAAKRPPRVVIDTNLVLSALVFANGRLTPLRQAWQARRVQPLVSRVTADERRIADLGPPTVNETRAVMVGT